MYNYSYNITMEYKVQNPYTALLAFRWYFATYQELIQQDKETIMEEFEDEDECCTVVHGKTLNGEARGYYLISTHDEELTVDYCVELFGRPELTCTVNVYKASLSWDDTDTPFREGPDVVKFRIQKFCSQIHMLCKCGSTPVQRLGNRCEDCFVFSFRRFDDRCAICLENEGRWIQLSCSHVIHVHCWNDLQQTTKSANRAVNCLCPVCRAIINPQKCQKNYPYSLLPKPTMNRE